MIKEKENLSKIETMEMGKPINESRFVIQKSIDIIKHYRINMEDYLKPNIIDTFAKKSYIAHLPLGPVFNITP